MSVHTNCADQSRCGNLQLWSEILQQNTIYDDVITQILQDGESKVEQYHKEKDQKIHKQALTVAKAMSEVWSSGKYEFR